MTTHTVKTTEAQRFAADVTGVVREKLARLPEQQLIAYLDALHDTLEMELWMARMELESIADSDREAASLPNEAGRPW
jgi:hypothetical protein